MLYIILSFVSILIFASFNHHLAIYVMVGADLIAAKVSLCTLFYSELTISYT